MAGGCQVRLDASSIDDAFVWVLLGALLALSLFSEYAESLEVHGIQSSV